jgi:predicted Zn-dependent protease
MRKYDQACKYLDIMHKQQPSNSFFTYNLALSLLNLKKAGEAAPLFQECMKRSKDHPYAALHYGRCLFEMGKKQEAKKELNALLGSGVEVFVKQDTLSYMKEIKLA